VHRNIFRYYNQPAAKYLKCILFRNNTLHVLEGISVHQQESKTVHTASGICQTAAASNSRYQLLLYTQFEAPDDERKDQNM
jgi:hypothetical protein